MGREEKRECSNNQHTFLNFTVTTDAITITTTKRYIEFAIKDRIRVLDDSSFNNCVYF